MSLDEDRTCGPSAHGLSSVGTHVSPSAPPIGKKAWMARPSAGQGGCKVVQATVRTLLFVSRTAVGLRGDDEDTPQLWVKPAD
jgi:hypothetical protein